MNSSGSNSVRVDNVFVPGHCTCSGDWTHHTTVAAPGMYLHDDPMFCGRIYAMYHAGLVIPIIGAARGSLNEYEDIIRTKKTYFAPQVPRYTVEEYQRHYGRPARSPTAPRPSSCNAATGTPSSPDAGTPPASRSLARTTRPCTR